eukprot:TRINITY_DN17917_c1_g1_i3.p1 TRINITY_DN17917_c1_g1~~TRINITY_DN17917_c1_g1_i3.p1  ORF type:complete len:596 (-),score=99.67 TRINITY_DN17917_c1_g1_i3:112-1899(-)
MGFRNITVVIQISDFTEQNLSNTCWAYAKLGFRHDPLIKAIADETQRKLPQFSAQGLVNTLWGFATLVIKGEECLGQSAWQLICALLEEIMRRLPTCTTQELSNSSWACCRLGVKHEGFLTAIAEEGMRKIHDYTCQDLSNSAMAFAKPNVDNRLFFEALAEHSFKKMRYFEAREISNSAWSFAIIGGGVVNSEWLDHALECFEVLVDRGEYDGWELVQLANTCWAHRRSLKRWPKLERTFHDRIFVPVVEALRAIIGRDEGIEAFRAPAEDTANSSSSSVGPRALLNAGPASHGSLFAAANKMPSRLSPLENAREQAQRLVTKLQVDFLGPVFTRVALRDLGFIDPTDSRELDAFGRMAQNSASSSFLQNHPEWGLKAREMTAEALRKIKSELHSMWFDRFGPHERRVHAWIAYRLEIEVSSKSARWDNGEGRRWTEVLSEDGRIAIHSLDELRAMNQRGCETFARLEASGKGEVNFTLHDVRQAQNWLGGLFAQHDRAGHCERQALLEVVLEVVNAIRRLQKEQGSRHSEASVEQGLFDGSLGASARGEMRLFVCHFCCISCCAAISNFARRFPLITMHIDFDDCWKTRLLDV